ncbi:MAG: glycoside hydrolase family 43 protein [Planctomycetota bacterium]|nr:MAG: glycoside hydrolase family 43 protein [Planctomycetota bacterium]
MTTLTNPILPGFNPDPSICRVPRTCADTGQTIDDYYIATSTFEWFGGVMIYHSRDLRHWRLIGPALTRREQINMLGNPDSGGVWAPCLSYADGSFWLVYSDTKTWQQGYKDVHNFVVTCDDIEAGAWSDPIYLNASGFDPSLFHDLDGRKWVLNQLWDHRPGRHPFAGIVIQEFDPAGQGLVGPIRNIFQGSSARVCEGPHLYHKDGWYYLLTAEGGTARHHCVTVARSRDLLGPYEIHPDNPILTSRHDLGLVLQNAGHADWVETATGEWWMVHLASRPLAGQSILGRETCAQRLEWCSDGWPRLAGGGREPRVEWDAPNLATHPQPSTPATLSFDTERIPACLQSLRIPAEESWVSLTARPGALRLYGQESLASRHRTSLLARRLVDFHARAEIRLDVTPRDFQHMAGLVAIYDSASWCYCYVSANDTGQRVLRMEWSVDGGFGGVNDDLLILPAQGPVDIACELRHLELRFFVRCDSEWQPVGPTRPGDFLGDEYGHHGHFTGGMMGFACQDLSGQGNHADFLSFTYLSL